MKVKDLLKILETMGSDALVIMSIDAEGNRFYPMDENGVSSAIYRPERAGHVGDIIDEEDGREEGDVDAVCFWPY